VSRSGVLTVSDREVAQEVCQQAFAAAFSHCRRCRGTSGLTRGFDGSRSDIAVRVASRDRKRDQPTGAGPSPRMVRRLDRRRPRRHVTRLLGGDGEWVALQLGSGSEHDHAHRASVNPADRAQRLLEPNASTTRPPCSPSRSRLRRRHGSLTSKSGSRSRCRPALRRACPSALAAPSSGYRHLSLSASGPTTSRRRRRRLRLRRLLHRSSYTAPTPTVRSVGKRSCQAFSTSAPPAA
jgi:hypothetical protein